MVVLTIALAAVPAAWAQTVTATLRIEYAEGTMLLPTKSVALEHHDLASHYGLTGIIDPGYVTAFHVLAEGLERAFGAGAAAQKLDFTVGDWGPFLNTIDDSNGSITNEANHFWAFVLNGEMAMVGLLGHQIADGDQIALVGDSWDDGSGGGNGGNGGSGGSQGPFTASWDSFRGNSYNFAITAANTPRSPQVGRAAWTQAVGIGVLSPVKVGDYLYIAGGSTLRKLNRAGQTVDSAQLAASVGRTGHLAAGSGKIFVPLAAGQVQAFDAHTLDPEWTSESFPSGWNSEGALTYRDGYLYGAAGETLLLDSEGTFFCLDISDGERVWTYSSPSDARETGFLWAGAAITDQVALFVGDDGMLVSHDVGGTQAGGVVDSVQLPSSAGGVRSPVLFVPFGDDGAGTAYVATRGGYVARVAVVADGSFVGQVQTAALSGTGSTSTPVAYRDRLYVVSGELLDSGYVDVFSATTLERLRSVQLPGFSQSSPLLSAANASAVNGWQVHLYVALNDTNDDVVRITDSELSAARTVTGASSHITATAIFSPGGSFTLNSLTADDSGRLYYVDGQGRFTAIEAVNAPPENGGGGGNNNGGGSNGGGTTGGGSNGSRNNNVGAGSGTATRTVASVASAPKTGDAVDITRWMLFAGLAASVAAAIVGAQIADRKKKKLEAFVQNNGGTSSQGDAHKNSSQGGGNNGSNANTSKS